MKKMPIYLVWKEEFYYGDGKEYFAVFDNLKDAEKYIKEKQPEFQENFYIQICKNGQEL